MGSEDSKPEIPEWPPPNPPKPPPPNPPKPPPPLPPFEVPWRKINWGDNATYLKCVREYMPGKGGVKHLRILLHGPVGAGKSSFINSVSSTIRGKTLIPALASTAFGQSFTTDYESHYIMKGESESYPFVINDIMGLEEGSRCGVCSEDIILAMKGHVKEGYEFKPLSPLTADGPDYNASPSADDKVHILVCLLSANSVEITDSVLKKMAEIREAASRLKIPQVAVLTKIDEACPDTKKDLKNVYKSVYLKKKLKDFSAAVGIPENCIFLVKNYSHEIDVDDEVDALVLSALRKIIDFGDNFICKMKPTESA